MKGPADQEARAIPLFASFLICSVDDHSAWLLMDTTAIGEDAVDVAAAAEGEAGATRKRSQSDEQQPAARKAARSDGSAAAAGRIWDCLRLEGPARTTLRQKFELSRAKCSSHADKLKQQGRRSKGVAKMAFFDFCGRYKIRGSWISKRVVQLIYRAVDDGALRSESKQDEPAVETVGKEQGQLQRDEQTFLQSVAMVGYVLFGAVAGTTAQKAVAQLLDMVQVPNDRSLCNNHVRDATPIAAAVTHALHRCQSRWCQSPQQQRQSVETEVQSENYCCHCAHHCVALQSTVSSFRRCC